MAAHMKCLFCICTKCVPSGPRNWYCPLCKATFDPKDDGEKGSDPARRAEAKEEYENRVKYRQSRGLQRKFLG